MGLKISNEEDNEIISNFTDHFYNYINECIESTLTMKILKIFILLFKIINTLWS
jgi:hypothetical protein